LPRDVIDPNDHETGFGTGLWPRLARGRAAPQDEPPPVTAPEEAGQRSEVDELWAELESALERETALRKALAEYGQLQARAADLEQALAVGKAELAGLRALVDEATRPKEEESARAYLRRQAEQNADLIWRSFQDGMTALRTDGSVDFRLRLEAARALLEEAYPESAPAERSLSPEQEAARDELAGLRARRANQQPS
jgi:hypothetical protein